MEPGGIFSLNQINNAFVTNEVRDVIKHQHFGDAVFIDIFLNIAPEEAQVDEMGFLVIVHNKLGKAVGVGIFQNQKGIL